jgi:hypothetical protein
MRSVSFATWTVLKQQTLEKWVVGLAWTVVKWGEERSRLWNFPIASFLIISAGENALSPSLRSLSHCRLHLLRCCCSMSSSPFAQPHFPLGRPVVSADETDGVVAMLLQSSDSRPISFSPSFCVDLRPTHLGSPAATVSLPAAASGQSVATTTPLGSLPSATFRLWHMAPLRSPSALHFHSPKSCCPLEPELTHLITIYWVLYRMKHAPFLFKCLLI